MEQKLALGFIAYIGLSIFAVYYLRACVFEYYAARTKLSPRESIDLLNRIGSRFAAFVLTLYFDQLGNTNELRMMERLRAISVQHSRMGFVFFLVGPVTALLLMVNAVLEHPTTSGYMILGYCVLLLLGVVHQSLNFSRKLMMEYALIGGKHK